MENYLNQIRAYCEENSDPAIVQKYSRYFKEGYDGFGLDHKRFQAQKEKWIGDWSKDLSFEEWLHLCDDLMQHGRFEEQSLAILFLEQQKENYTKETFSRIGKWFDFIDNWATTDVLCMLVMPEFLMKEILSFEEFKAWNSAESEWQRRAVPVTLVELQKKGLNYQQAIDVVEPLMLDQSVNVQKGLGTLLRGMWKKNPVETEVFLMKWKDRCGRVIIQYASEKMDKEYRKKFRKQK